MFVVLEWATGTGRFHPPGSVTLIAFETRRDVIMDAIRRLVGLWILAAACAALPVRADSLVLRGVDQAAFDRFAKDVTAAFDYRPLLPSAHGMLGLDVSGFGSVAQIHDRAAYRTVTGRRDSTISIGGAQVTKGLPGNMDVGVFLAGVTGNSMTLYGAQLRYAVLEGTPVTPSLTLGGHYTGAAGLDDFSYRSWGLDATIAQSLLMFKPYAGVGYVWGRLVPHHGIVLEPADANQVKGFVGLRLALLPILHLGAQYERLGATNTYSLTLGMSLL